jgi:hypothetical protein
MDQAKRTDCRNYSGFTSEHDAALTAIRESRHERSNSEVVRQLIMEERKRLAKRAG